MGLIEASSKRAYAVPRSTAPRAPAPAAGCCWPIPPQETFRHSSGSVSEGWTCVLCRSQCWRAQVTRCLVSALSQVSCASTSLVPATHFPGCAARALSQVCRMSPLESWSQTVTRMVAVSHPGSQEDMVSSWEPAHCLMEDAISGTEIAAAPCSRLWLLQACLSVLRWGGAVMQQASPPLVFSQSFVLWAGQAMC